MNAVTPAHRKQIERQIRRAAGGRLPESKITAKVDAEIRKLEARQQRTLQARQQHRETRRREREEEQAREVHEQQARERRNVSEPLEAEVVAGDPHGNLSGLHVRPAAMLAHRLREECPGVRVEARGPATGGRFVPVSGIYSLLGLGARYGDTIELRVYGPRVKAERVVQTFREVLGETLSAVPHQNIARELDLNSTGSLKDMVRAFENAGVVRSKDG